MCQSIIHNCTICSQEFKAVKGKGNKFCSMPCYRIHQRSGSYAARESKRIAECAHCHSEITNKSPKKLAGGEDANLYCERACYDAHRKRPAIDLAKDCIECGCSFYRSGAMKESTAYCSVACRTKHEKPAPVSCIACGVLFSALQIRSDGKSWYVRLSSRKTCSPECVSVSRRTNQDRKDKISAAFSGAKHPNWQGGSHYGSKRGAGWNQIAEQCRDLHGRKCKSCGMLEADSILMGWGRLQVNHIKPFHQWANKTHANRQSNLEALCKSCHTRIDWAWRKSNPVQMSLAIYR